MENNKYDWIEYYMEFADKLLEYKNNRAELISILVSVFQDINLQYPLKDGDKEVGDDVCPFSVIGVFNRQITTENRISILTKFKEKFNIKSNIPSDFSGIPVLNNMSSMFYHFSEWRKEKDIPNLWDLYEIAIKYADNPSRSNYQEFCMKYNIVIKQPRVKWNITMGLFWIRPYTYINLDTKNRTYFQNCTDEYSNVRNIDNLKNIPTAEKYIEIINECKNICNNDNSKYKNFIELSDNAFISNSKSSNATFLKWFKPILESLKELGGSGTPNEVREKIIEIENLSNEEIDIVRGKTKVNKFENEVAFARNYMVYEELIDGSERGIWKITDKGRNINMTDDEASKIFTKWVNVLKEKRENKKLEINYWLVGADWRSEGDQTNRFISEGIWENGYDDKYIDVVNQIKKGDKIAIKSTYTKRNNIPFNSNGEPVSVMKIKVTGTVIENVKNGKQVKVKWDEINEREWYMFTYIKTIWNITPDGGKWNWMKQNLVEFVFEGKEQNYQEFLDDPFWKDRYENIEEEDIEEMKNQKYLKEQFLNEVYIDEKEYNNLVNLIRRKKNVLLQGAPGVGKTFMAKRLAYSIIGEKDSSRIQFIQFHQSYSYEDFIEGYRPTENSFALEKGIFYNFCKLAESNLDKEYFFIIDEINRGNLSKIFGELLMLIENDKRGEKLNLAYSKSAFSVPENLYIIGMMNTADRSLALIDYALRRRFSFYQVNPAFENEQFKEYQKELHNEKFNKLIDNIKQLNIEIEQDPTLGKGFKIGHSYFCNINQITDEIISSIVKYEIIPLIEEYWFDDMDKFKVWCDKLNGVING